MEYLVNYGWAILAIGVILTVLYSIGIFNAFTFTPKAKAGGCQVVDGSLQGECTGEIPDFVGQFDGQSTIVDIPSLFSLYLGSSITVSAWVKLSSKSCSPTACAIFSTFDGANGYMLYVVGTSASIYDYNPKQGNSFIGSSKDIADGSWHFVVGEWTATGSTIYVDGVQVGSGNGNFISPTKDAQIGAYCTTPPFSNCGYYFPGYISNVQLYNTTLPANEVTRLYDEGIGGAPIDQIYAVGWWPLNGNSNDYSGFNNNAKTNGMFYTDSWYSGYTAP